MYTPNVQLKTRIILKTFFCIFEVSLSKNISPRPLFHAVVWMTNEYASCNFRNQFQKTVFMHLRFDFQNFLIQKQRSMYAFLPGWDLKILDRGLGCWPRWKGSKVTNVERLPLHEAHRTLRREGKDSPRSHGVPREERCKDTPSRENNEKEDYHCF